MVFHEFDIVLHQLLVCLLLYFLLLLLFSTYLLTPDDDSLSKALVFDCCLCFAVSLTSSTHPRVLMHCEGPCSTERHRQTGSRTTQGSQICSESAPENCQRQANAAEARLALLGKNAEQQPARLGILCKIDSGLPAVRCPLLKKQC